MGASRLRRAGTPRPGRAPLCVCLSARCSCLPTRITADTVTVSYSLFVSGVTVYNVAGTQLASTFTEFHKIRWFGIARGKYL